MDYGYKKYCNIWVMYILTEMDEYRRQCKLSDVKFVSWRIFKARVVGSFEGYLNIRSRLESGERSELDLLSG